MKNGQSRETNKTQDNTANEKDEAHKYGDMNTYAYKYREYEHICLQIPGI